jgi:hypothetical protein
MIDGARSSRLVAALACAGATGLVIATAGSGATGVSTDPNDTKGPIDILSSTVSKTKSGLRKHVVKFYAPVPAKGQTGNEYLELWAKQPHPLPGAPPGAFKEAPYKIMGPQTGKRPVFTGGEDGTPVHKTGTATVTRKGNTLTFVFSLKAIGSPKGFYYWHVKSDYYGPNSACPMGPCEDNLPDGSKAVKQAI